MDAFGDTSEEEDKSSVLKCKMWIGIGDKMLRAHKRDLCLPSFRIHIMLIAEMHSLVLSFFGSVVPWFEASRASLPYSSTADAS